MAEAKQSVTLKLYSLTHNSSYSLTHITYGTLQTTATTSSTVFEYFLQVQTCSYNADSNFNTKSGGNNTYIYNLRVYHIVTYPTMFL